MNNSHRMVNKSEGVEKLTPIIDLVMLAAA